MVFKMGTGRVLIDHWYMVFIMEIGGIFIDHSFMGFQNGSQGMV